MMDDDEDISAPFDPYSWLLGLLMWACIIGFVWWVWP